MHCDRALGVMLMQARPAPQHHQHHVKAVILNQADGLAIGSPSLQLGLEPQGLARDLDQFEPALPRAQRLTRFFVFGHGKYPPMSSIRAETDLNPFCVRLCASRRALADCYSSQGCLTRSAISPSA